MAQGGKQCYLFFVGLLMTLITVAEPVCHKISQTPRYLGVRKGSTILIRCNIVDFHSPNDVTWEKRFNDFQEDIVQGGQSQKKNTNNYTTNGVSSVLHIKLVEYADSGIYYCKVKNNSEYLHGCGTELKVIGHGTEEDAAMRNTLKDAVIVIQTFLLFMCLLIPMLLIMNKNSMKKSDEDHTYEGLEIDQMATYEDIGIARNEAAKWTAGEHPCQE